MFDEESMIKWANELQGEEKAFVKEFLRYVHKYTDNTFMEALINARKTLILRKAICIIGYAELKTPKEVFNELKA